MATDKNGGKHGSATVTINGVQKTVIVPLVVVDGKVVPDTANVRTGVNQ